MENITKEQFLLYKKALKLENIIDLETLIIHYQDALLDYYDDNIYDISKLNLIMESFLYFTQFEIIENDYNKLIDKFFEMRQKENLDISEFSRSEFIYMQSILITTDLLKDVVEIMNEDQIKSVYESLYKLFSIYETIKKYEQTQNNVQKNKSIIWYFFFLHSINEKNIKKSLKNPWFSYN